MKLPKIFVACIGLLPLCATVRCEEGVPPLPRKGERGDTQEPKHDELDRTIERLLIAATSEDAKGRNVFEGEEGKRSAKAIVAGIRSDTFRVKYRSLIIAENSGAMMPELIPCVFEVLLNDKDEASRLYAARALLAISASESLLSRKDYRRKLIEALRDESEAVSGIASMILRNIGESSLPELENCLSDKNDRVVARAALAIGQMGSVAEGALKHLGEARQRKDLSDKTLEEIDFAVDSINLAIKAAGGDGADVRLVPQATSTPDNMPQPTAKDESTRRPMELLHDEEKDRGRPPTTEKTTNRP